MSVSVTSVKPLRIKQANSEILNDVYAIRCVDDGTKIITDFLINDDGKLVWVSMIKVKNAEKT